MVSLMQWYYCFALRLYNLYFAKIFCGISDMDATEFCVAIKCNKQYFRGELKTIDTIDYLQ